MATGEVNYRLKADASGMTSEVEKARRSVDGLDKSQKSAGKSAKGMGDQSTAIDKLRKSFAGLGTVIAGLGIGLAFRKMIQNTAQQDAAMAQLNATLKSTEFAAGKSAEELTRTAASLQKVTTYGDEAIIGMQSLLLTFKDIKGDNFDRTTRAVLDMSTAMGQDLKSSAIQLGKALNDPIGQLGALSRTGVTFSDTQKDMIKSMAAAGDMAGAQVLILKELESQFGGSAEAARDTLGGALKGLENAYNDLFEAESSTSASMVKGINSIEKSITNPALKDGINLVIESLMKLFEWITKVYEGWYMLGQVLADGIAKLREQTGWFTDDLDRMGEELTATVKPMEMLREVTVQAERNTKDLGDAIRTVSIVSDDERESVDRLQSVVVTATKINKEYSEATRDIADSTEEATAAQSPFQQALQGTAERIDTAFKSAWQGAFDSFSDFADGLKNAFKELLAELAHLAITRPIIMNIGAAFGLGGASGAASAAGGLPGGGSLLGLLSGGVSSGLGSLGSLYTSAGNLFGAGSTIGNAALAQGRLYSYGSIGQGLASLGLNLGAGFAGGYLGNSLFGNTSGVGSFLGGAAGSIFGPVGTGVGAFFGSGAERLLGNVFGFGGNGGNNAGRSIFNLGTGLNNAFGIGNNFDQANVDTASSLVNTLQAFANILGGSNFSGSVKVGNRSGIKLDGQRFNSPEEFFQATFQAIIDGATNLDEPLRSLIGGFEGTAEEMMRFSAAVISLSEQASINSVTQAIEDFTAQQPTVMQAYLDQTVAVWDMVRGFDGSASAAEELNVALITNKAAAYEFALAIQSIGESINRVAEEQALAIRESVLTEEELRAKRRNERNELRALLPTLTDPQEIEETANRILELNKLIFDSLSEAQQQARAEDFAVYAENTSFITDKVLDRALRVLEATQEDLNTAVSTMLQNAASAQQNAANTQVHAANQFAAWVARLTSQGITVTVNQATPEVNV